ncbi:alpha-galactosidase [Streptomyces monticola]|uniref:Alpha-galactosidase n=1 Tax=Streptomyces monticola TaxID=2666263 RepID=A0ABW2JHY4_9ACTN
MPERPMPTSTPAPLILTAAGTSLVLDRSGDGIPQVLHWGTAVDPKDLESPESPFDPALFPTPPPWPGRPALTGIRDGSHPHLRLVRTAPVEHTAATVTVRTADEAAAVAVVTEFHLDPHGTLRRRHTVTNTATDGSTWSPSAIRGTLPLPEQATELLDLTGRWGYERVPQRTPFAYGTHLRETRQGRPGHDSATLLVAGTPGFGFRHGQVWAVHTAHSGESEHSAERHPGAGGVLAGGEILAPGELRLAQGESYTSPWIYFLHSDTGLDGISERLHRHLRARPHHPRTPRPVHLNTWEAVYFDHDLDRLKRLADRAREVGVERFVLDDGWFKGRRDDTAGLGDWYVDPKVWPQGLHPLTGHVRALGMEFGLWVEPEMVNPDSGLARAHPDWLLSAPGRTPAPVRNQQVLDLAHPEAYAYVLERLDALLTEYPIAYLKWDHNRPLKEAVHAGVAGVHAQTKAVYALLDRLRALHPRLEIESCASGGARVDLGIIERTDRVWASDTNDPVDRQHIQRWTSLLLPPELIGTHVGPPTTHVTGRTTRLSFRCATALFGHAGIEWDITGCTGQELDELRAWIAAYKRLRPLLHTGTVVRADHPDPSALLHGVVGEDRTHALFAYAQLDTPVPEFPTRLRLPGLAPEARYRIAPVLPSHTPLPPLPRTATGRALTTIGLPLPRLAPADAVILELTSPG